MTLGGLFGEGPDFYNRVSTGISNLFRDGDTLGVFGWSTTDLPTNRVNWQSGLFYRTRVLTRRRQTVTIGGGIQRWLFPSVKTGAQDWVAAGTLAYTRASKKVPLTVNVDSVSLLRSAFSKGSAIYTQVQTQRTLYRREGFQLLLRHGPHHTYSWGFYGTEGNRVVRYACSVVANWKKTTFEAGLRQQFGLQDGIRDNRFWTFQLSREISRPLHLRKEAPESRGF